MKHLLIVATPAALANGVVQINLLVGQLVSSQQVGAISWLYGADRLYQLPLGVVGIAVGIVLLPELSRHLKSGDEDAAKEALSNGAFFTAALSFPATIALFVIPLPLAAALYGYGQNTAADVQAIALATAIYALGLPAFMLQKLQQPLFFAREDTQTPFRWAVVSMVINALVAIGLWPWLGWLSPAIATVISSWAMVGLLQMSARKFGDVARIKTDTTSKIVRVAIASIAMGIILAAAQYGLGDYFVNGAMQFVWTLILVSLGAVAYIILARVCGAFRLGELRSAMRR
jgi:putative peptidoglycan lipid II flippase